MPGRRDFTLTMGLEGAATIVTGLNQLIQLVGRFVAKVKEVAGEIQQYRRVVEGHSVSVEQARRATAGLIDTIELHRGAAQLEAAGIRVTAEQLRGLSVSAADFARRTGRDVTETFQELTRAVIGTEAEGLRRYNITLREGGQISQRQAQVLSQLTERFGDQRLEVQDTQEAISSLEHAWSDAWHEMALAIEDQVPFIRDALGQITDWLEDVAAALETQRRAAHGLRVSALLDEQAAATARRLAAEQALSAAGISIETAERVSLREVADIQEAQAIRRRGMAGRAGAMGRIITGEREYTPEAAAAIEAYRSAQYEISQLEIQIQEAEAARETAERARIQVAGQPTIRFGRGRAAPSEQPIGEYLSGSMQILFDDFERRAGEWQERQEQLVQADVDRWAKRSEDLATFFEDLDQRQETSAEAFARAENAKRQAIEATTAAMEAQIKSAERTVSTFETISSVTSALGGVMDRVSGIVVAAAGEDEKAVERMKVARGVFLIAEAVVQAALEAARAAASFAEQDYSGGAMHVIAAAMYAAAAVKAGVEMGASSKTGSASTSARAYPEHRGGARDERSEPQPIVVNINGPVTSRRVQEDVDEMRRGSARSYG